MKDHSHEDPDHVVAPAADLAGLCRFSDESGTEGGEEPYEVVLQFDAYQARWIREAQWHSSQQIEEHEDGSLTLRLTVSGDWRVRRWILSHGSHVEVREPSWLRDRVAQELVKALALYGLVGIWMWW